MENRKVKEFEQKESSERSVEYDSQRTASSTTATNVRSSTVASLPGNLVEEETKEETTPNILDAISEKKRSAVRRQQALEDHSDARAEGEDVESQQSSGRFCGRASNPMASSSTASPRQDDSLSSKKRFAVRRQALDDASGYDSTTAGQNYEAQRVAESLPSLESRPGAYPVFPSGNVVNQDDSEDSDAYNDDMQEEHEDVFVLSAERVDVSMDELRQANEEMQEILTERSPSAHTSAVPLDDPMEEAAPRQDRSTDRFKATGFLCVITAAIATGILVSTLGKSEPPIVLRNTFRPTGASSQAPSWKPSQAPSISFPPSSSVQPSAGPCSVNIPDTWDYAQGFRSSIRMYFETGQSPYGIPLGRWCVESVRDFSGAFYHPWSYNNPSDEASLRLRSFNEPLNQWDVSSATRMDDMFRDSSSFNQDLSSWNVSTVERMDGMFYYASSFNQDLSSWNVARVSTMHSIFYRASSFNGNVSTWDVSRVEDMESMFLHAYEFNRDISAWNVSRVVNMRSMFERAGLNQDLSSWNVSRVEWMDGMFASASSFNQHMSSWDTARVRTMHSMFDRATSFNGNVSTWDVSRVEDMGSMFYGAHEFSGDISAWNVSRVVNMRSMFEGTIYFGRNRDLSMWNVSGVEDMQRMFFNARAFTGNITTWDVSRVRAFRSMFDYATSFRQDLCAWGAHMRSDADVIDMFRRTDCPEQGEPNLTATPVSPLCFTCT